jgi:DNA-binding CsgD family transcriptional regulator
MAYEPDEYEGGNQNWMLSQGEEGFIYVANNKGLLEFNGMQWTLYPSPNETIIRAVRVVGKRVYTGCYREFGYWQRDEAGRLQYNSLSESVQDKMVPDEHFWNIIAYEEYLVFQSLYQLFLYDLQTQTIRVIRPPEGVDKLMATEDGLYLTDRQPQLYKLETGELKPLLSGQLTDCRIMHLWPLNGQLYFQTADDGRFRLDKEKGTLTKLPQPDLLRGKSIYSAITLSDGRHAYGTISDGIYLLTPDGTLLHHLTQTKGLSNNTILSLFEDQKQNLWAGTDNGISAVNLASPIRRYADETGRLGTVYAAVVQDSLLYLGTNQGLFYRPLEADTPFRLVPKTKGQVWSLFVFEGELFCGHDAGTFIVEGASVEAVYESSGTWCFEPVPGQEGLLLQGNYDGLTVMEQVGGQWRFRNKIEGFDYSARFLGVNEQLEAYVSHEYNGVFGLQLNEALRKVITFKPFKEPAKGKNASLTDYRGRIWYASKEGMFRLQRFEEGFVKDTSLSRQLRAEEYESGKMTVDEQGRMWLFTQSSMHYFSQGLLDESLNIQSVPVPADMINAMSGYENIAWISDDRYLIGTADGYLLLDLDDLPVNDHRLYLSAVRCRNIDQVVKRLPLSGESEVGYAFNSLTFEFTVPAYSSYFMPRFQYRLKGFYDQWSDWSPEATLTFKNLPYGSYELELRSRVGLHTSDNVLHYTFTILRPWYWSNLAIVLYLLLGAMLVYVIHRAYTRYYLEQEDKLRKENQQQLETQQRDTELALFRMKNEQLQRDIDNKNRELAISTMSLVKKNELLHQIKNQLEAEGEINKNVQSVISTIDKNTDEEETWNFFKEAFENADQEFFKKIKQRHPSLTHNDLKLCAYLRLNLSSKEIAPLLNISVRSVEVKRYRLRKKMELEPDEGLVEYILEV